MRIGKFENALHLSATLAETTCKGWWIYRPAKAKPLFFRRDSGEIIQPEGFITDLGTIPKWLRLGRLLQPDSIPAVALVHDWVVRQNNCGLGTRSFEDSVLVQQEALKTWMETHPKDRSMALFHLSRLALLSNRSKRGWCYKFESCPPTLEDIIEARREISRGLC